MRTPGIFYGWWMVAASFVIAMCVGGIVFYGFTAIFEPIANELNWSYTRISVAASLRGVEMGILAPVVGIFVDRLGPRKIIAAGAIMTATGLVMLSYTYSLAMFYGAFVLIAIGMSCCASTVLMAAVSNWFESRVGFASGIALSGFGFGGLLLPLMVKLIETYEWRLTMVFLALLVIIVVVPLSLVFRNRPEQYGQLPDGKTEDDSVSDNASGPATCSIPEYGPRGALRSRAFWHIALATTCHTMVLTAIVTHIMPYLSSIGLDRSLSAMVASVIPLISIAGRLSFGWLGDRKDRIRVSALAFAMMSIGAVSLGLAAGSVSWVLLLFLLFYGIGYGAVIALRPSLVREFFGRGNFGTIFGLVIGINLSGGLVGPILAGWVFDEYGGYEYVWYAFAALMLAAVFLTAAAGRFRDRASDMTGALEL